MPSPEDEDEDEVALPARQTKANAFSLVKLIQMLETRHNCRYTHEKCRGDTEKCEGSPVNCQEQEEKIGAD